MPPSPHQLQSSVDPLSQQIQNSVDAHYPTKVTWDKGASTFDKEVMCDFPQRLIKPPNLNKLRASTAPRYVKPEALDQLKEWIKENPIPYWHL
jgi:hypothetical protein